MLEFTATPTHSANQVKDGHTLDQLRNVQSCRPERAHQNNEQWWRSSWTNCRLSRQFWEIKWPYLLFKCGIKTKTHLEWVLWHWSSLSVELKTYNPLGLTASWVAMCQLTLWRSVSKKPCTWVFIVQSHRRSWLWQPLENLDRSGRHGLPSAGSNWDPPFWQKSLECRLRISVRLRVQEFFPRGFSVYISAGPPAVSICGCPISRHRIIDL